MDIYQLTNTVNGKIYIGKAADLKARLYMHSRAYDHARSSLHRAIRKHGFASFSVQVLEDGIADEQLLNEREIYWIRIKKSSDRSVGYNLTAGGEGMLGWKASEETRAKLSAMRKGKMPAPHVMKALHESVRKPKTPEHRAKIAASHIGIRPSKETKAKISKARTNFITHEGQTRSVTEWAEVAGMGVAALRWRLHMGWGMAAALSIKKHVRRGK